MDLGKDEFLWKDTACRLILNAVSHPIEYARVLTQIGHEPLAPYPTRTIFGKPALALPNVFKYIKYIKTTDGLTGCYIGCVPRLCALTVNALATEKTEKLIKSKYSEQQTEPEEEEERTEKYIQEFIRNLIGKTVGIICSHPLDVITLRMMAQFVGRETKYTGFLQSITEIYKENGLSGYFAGLMPRLIGNAVTLIIVSSSTYAINKYIITDPEMKSFTAAATSFIATAITYPFMVVSHCMAVNDCGLAAGVPPQMPIYASWVDCWSDLSDKNQLKRGSSLLWRYYTGPTNALDGPHFSIRKVGFSNLAQL